jgi:hypothetical protein
MTRCSHPHRAMMLCTVAYGIVTSLLSARTLLVSGAKMICIIEVLVVGIYKIVSAFLKVHNRKFVPAVLA